MTEQEWMECGNPLPMLEFLRAKVADRRLVQFSYACCQRVAHLLQEKSAQHALAAVERCAEGTIKPGTVRRLLRCVSTSRKARVKPYSPEWFANLSVESIVAADQVVRPDQCCHFVATTIAVAAGHVYGSEPWMRTRDTESRRLCGLLRDIAGPLPFRQVRPNPAWLNLTVTSLAQAIYADRAFDRLPILADALEDAGCTNADILNHCRQPGEHVRGCWAVDLVLGRS
jgi:hypothetical protein